MIDLSNEIVNHAISHFNSTFTPKKVNANQIIKKIQQVISLPFYATALLFASIDNKFNQIKSIYAIPLKVISKIIFLPLAVIPFVAGKLVGGAIKTIRLPFHYTQDYSEAWKDKIASSCIGDQDKNKNGLAKALRFHDPDDYKIKHIWLFGSYENTSDVMFGSTDGAFSDFGFENKPEGSILIVFYPKDHSVQKRIMSASYLECLYAEKGNKKYIDRKNKMIGISFQDWADLTFGQLPSRIKLALS